MTLALLILVNRHILLQFMNSADEHACRFLSQCFLQFKTWAPEPPLSDFFQTPNLGIKEGKWFSVYPPAWPALMAAATALNLFHWINPICACLSLAILALLFKKIYGSSLVSSLGIILCITSPFFLLNSSSYYSHPLCLLCFSFFLFCIKHSLHSPNIFWGLGAGLALGIGCATRYLTMASLSAPIIFFYLNRAWNNKSPHQKTIILTVLFIFISVTSLHMIYNYSITGSWIKLPNNFLHPHERLGFIAGYTPLTAIQYLLKRFLYLIDWTPPLLMFCFLIAFTFRNKSSFESALFQSVLFLPIGYMLYYSWGGNQYGPRYLYEAFPVAVFLTAGFFRKMSVYSHSFKCWIHGILIGMLFTSMFPLVRHLTFFQKATSERKFFYQTVESSVRRPAVVFINGFIGKSLVMSQDDGCRNDPFLKNDILYVHDLKEKNGSLKPFFPDRAFYLAYNSKNHLPVIKEI